MAEGDHLKTVRRLLYRDIVGTVMFVALAFMALFFFIGFVEELERLREGASAARAALLAVTDLPSQFYEVFPIAVLIGTTMALARLAQSSEFTILRTGGLGPGRAFSLLSALAAAFAALTFLTGDWLAPMADQWGQRLRAAGSQGLLQRAGGAWLKDRQQLNDGSERLYTVSVAGATLDGRVERVRVFEFDAQNRLLERWEAASGHVSTEGQWLLQDERRQRWPVADAAQPVTDERLPLLTWQSRLTRNVVSAALLRATDMSTAELFTYTRHLAAQEQSAQRYEIQFWRKALYPFACFVMMALALPFAYLHARGGGISARVFGGIMLGISFVLLNNLLGHVGLLQNWTPWAVAAAPSLLYLGLSMTAFAWLVRYR